MLHSKNAFKIEIEMFHSIILPWLCIVGENFCNCSLLSGGLYWNFTNASVSSLNRLPSWYGISTQFFPCTKLPFMTLTKTQLLGKLNPGGIWLETHNTRQWVNSTSSKFQIQSFCWRAPMQLCRPIFGAEASALTAWVSGGCPFREPPIFVPRPGAQHSGQVKAPQNSYCSLETPYWSALSLG